MLLHVGVSNVKVAALSASEIHCGLLLFEIDVAFITNDSFGLVEWLGESRRFGEGVWSSRCTHVSVFALKSLCVNCNRTSLSVIALGDTIAKFSISCLGCAPVHACFVDEVLVTAAHGDELAVLGLHDLASNSVLSQIFLVKVLSVCGVKVTLLVLGVEGSLAFSHFLHHLALNLSLKLVSFAANASDSGSLVLASAVLSVVSVHDLLV